MSKEKKNKPTFKEWMSENLRYILLIAIIIIAVILVIVLVGLFSQQNQNAAQTASSSVTYIGAEAESGSVSASSESVVPEKTMKPTNEPTETPTPTVKPTETATPEPTPEPVSESTKAEAEITVQKYFRALATGDVELAQQVTEGLSEADLQAIANKQFAESYSDVTVYAYPADEEDSYVVIADYLYQDPDEAVPQHGVTAFYVFRSEDGSLRLAANELEEQKKDVIAEVVASEEVQKLLDELEQ